MEKSLLSLAEKLSPDVSFCLVWLEDDGIVFDMNTKNISETMEMLYLMCHNDIILDSACAELPAEDAEKLRASMNFIKEQVSNKTKLDTTPLVKPINMSK